MNHIEGHQNNNRPRVFRMKKIILSLLFILTIFSANQILAQDQDQDQGTDMAPWAKSILQPLMGKPLQASFELINDQGFSLTYIDKYGFDPDLYNGTGGNNKLLISTLSVTIGLYLSCLETKARKRESSKIGEVKDVVSWF